MAVKEHHGGEETKFFPWIEEYIGIPGHLSPNIEQHHAFEPGLEELSQYVTAAREGKETYDGTKMKRIIDGFGEILNQHLIDEVAFLETLEKYDDKIDWAALNKRIIKHAKSTVNIVCFYLAFSSFIPSQHLKDHGPEADMISQQEFVLSLVLTNGDNTFEPGVHDPYWPPLPFYVRWIIRYIYVPKQKGAWRFSCSDSYGNPRDLPFVDPLS